MGLKTVSVPSWRVLSLGKRFIRAWENIRHKQLIQEDIGKMCCILVAPSVCFECLYIDNVSWIQIGLICFHILQMSSLRPSTILAGSLLVDVCVQLSCRTLRLRRSFIPYSRLSTDITHTKHRRIFQNRAVPLLPHNAAGCYRDSGYRYIRCHANPSISAATSAHFRQGNGFYTLFHINID